MAVEAENMCFESMGFGPFALSGTQDWCTGPGLGILDVSCLQELPQIDQLKRQLHHPVVDSDYTPVSSCVGSLPVEIAQSLFSDLEKQMKELDSFLQWENKRLRRSILQESRRHQSAILQIYESTISSLMLRKDEEIAVARNKTRELQDLFTAAKMEAKAWERRAREKEAIVSDLNKKLNQAKEDDAVSFCGSSSGEGRGEEQSTKRMMMMACKLCQARSLCVVFFPCRHLCCCKFCESLLGHCPVCETVKEASLEVSLG